MHPEKRIKKIWKDNGESVTKQEQVSKIPK